MRTARLFILLLSVNRPITTFAHLVKRQEQGFWPDFGFLDGLAVFRGAGDLFENPQDSDTATTQPPPTTDTTSDRQTLPDSPKAAPASPPASDTPSPTEQVYKLKINNNPSPIPEAEPILPAALPLVNEKCDPMNASPQLFNISKLLFQCMTFALVRLIWILIDR